MQFKNISLSLTIFSLTISLFCFSQKIDRKESLSLAVKLDDSTKGYNKNLLMAKTTLTNSSSDTITYITMSCSWQDSYTTDSKDLFVEVNECDKNVPELIRIPPHSSHSTILKLMSNTNINQLKGLQFRVGFNLVTAKDYDEMNLKLWQLTQMQNVVWSDPLIVN